MGVSEPPAVPCGPAGVALPGCLTAWGVACRSEVCMCIPVPWGVLSLLVQMGPVYGVPCPALPCLSLHQGGLWQAVVLGSTLTLTSTSEECSAWNLEFYV